MTIPLLRGPETYVLSLAGWLVRSVPGDKHPVPFFPPSSTLGKTQMAQPCLVCLPISAA